MSVSSSGLVTGTLPTLTSPANYSVTVDAINGAGTGSQTFTLTVNPPAPVVTNPGPMTAASGAAFSYQIIATNTPTSYIVTAAGLTLNVNGSGLVSGTLPTVTSPTSYSITLNATNVSGTGSQTFTLGINPPAPIANAASMTVPLNTPTTLDLASSISGSATSISIVTLPAHGTVTVSGTQVSYVPNHNYFGADAFSYVAIGSGGTSAPAVVTVTIVGRPDPSTDKEVIGLLASQRETAQRFAKAQISNFQQRLESLHQAPVAIAQEHPQQDFATSNYYNQSGMQRDMPAGFAAYRNDPSRALLTEEKPSAASPSLLANIIVHAVTTSSVNLAMLAEGSSSSKARDNAGIWGAGNVRYGSRTPASGGVIDFTTDGASLGVDRRIDEALTLGMGLGYARDKSAFGIDGTASSAKGWALVSYASYMLTPTLFVDSLIGYGTLNFDSARYVSWVNDFARTHRKGNQLFGSLATGYEYRADNLLMSPYGRYDFTTDHLAAATETGAGLNALSYSSQTSRSSQMSLGLRSSLSHEASFGLLAPHARMEYQHSIEQGEVASLAYADLFNGTRYSVAPTTTNNKAWVFGVGSSLLLYNGFKLGVEYETQRSVTQEKSQAINFRLSKALGG